MELGIRNAEKKEVGKVGKKARVGDRERGLKAQSSKLKEGRLGVNEKNEHRTLNGVNI